MYSPFEIVYATLEWKGVTKERTWMIVDRRLNGEKYGLFPISTKNYGNAGPYYYIATTHPDFPATGLADNSYLFYETIFELEDPSMIRKCLGRIDGELLGEVIEASGLC